jgi:enoyl-CoA hydratase/carnithine racemase
MPDYREILLDISEGVATITLNRPEKMNAYTVSMGEELRDAIDRTDADDAVRAVIFTGAGERAFCAGTDLSPEGKDVPFASDDEIADLSDPRARDYGGLLTLRLFQSKKPLISACNGAAVGVGATIQLAMDMRLASVKARYGFVFTRRGISPDAAASWFLPRVVGRPQALEWAMTGRVFDAREALRGGLVRSLHEPAELIPAARALARELAEKTAPVSVALTRAMLWRDAELDHPMLAHRIDSRVIYLRSRSGDAVEGVASFFEKRAPRFPDTVSADMPDVWPWWDEPDWA